MSKRFIMAFAAACAVAALAAPMVGAQGQKGKCIVSGKEIEITDKTPRVSVQGQTQYFCCENCPKAFAKTPEKFVKSVGKCPIIGGEVAAPNPAERVVVNNGLWYVCCPGCNDGVATNTAVLKELRDVVSGKTFKGTSASPTVKHEGQVYIFESTATKAAFEKEPAKYAVIYAK